MVVTQRLNKARELGAYEEWQRRADKPMLMVSVLFLLVILVPVVFSTLSVDAHHFLTVLETILWIVFVVDKISSSSSYCQQPASNVGKSDATATSTSCDALPRYCRTLLQPVPDPPGAATASKFDDAEDAIYLAQKNCSSGLVRSADLATAAMEARNGATLLNQVLDETGD
jgi:hypothetical protein